VTLATQKLRFLVQLVASREEVAQPLRDEARSLAFVEMARIQDHDEQVTTALFVLELGALVQECIHVVARVHDQVALQECVQVPLGESQALAVYLALEDIRREGCSWAHLVTRAQALMIRPAHQGLGERR
jgi:hypothetical protein